MDWISFYQKRYKDNLRSGKLNPERVKILFNLIFKYLTEFYKDYEWNKEYFVIGSESNIYPSYFEFNTMSKQKEPFIAIQGGIYIFENKKTKEEEYYISIAVHFYKGNSSKKYFGEICKPSDEGFPISQELTPREISKTATKILDWIKKDIKETLSKKDIKETQNNDNNNLKILSTVLLDHILQEYSEFKWKKNINLERIKDKYNDIIQCFYSECKVNQEGKILTIILNFDLTPIRGFSLIIHTHTGSAYDYKESYKRFFPLIDSNLTKKDIFTLGEMIFDDIKKDLKKIDM